MGVRRILIGALGAMLIVPATASAAGSRYASPSGTSLAPCTQPSPCDIATAINNASPGDQIYLIANQGNFSISGGIGTPPLTPLHIHGFGGRANLVFSSGGLSVTGGTIDTVSVTNTTTGATVFSATRGTFADRMFVKGSNGSHPCYIESSTLTNSVCWTGANGDYTETDGSNTLRNDDFISNSPGALLLYARSCTSSCPVTYTNTLQNVIVRHGSPAGADIGVCSDSTAIAQVNVAYSNYGSAVTDLPGCTAADAHVNGDATDQSAAPQFVNAGAGDFHETSSSPTIDAGVTSAANGTLDLDGNPRTVGGKTDIGAYELGSRTPPPTTLTPPHGTKITKARIKKRRHKATFSFKASGTVTGFQCALAKQKKKRKHSKKKKVKLVFKSCRSPKTYKHLKHGHYIFEVRATNAAGVDPHPAVKKFKI